MRRGARILRKFLRQFRKILAGLGALEQALRLGLHGRILFRIVDRQQYVAHAALLGLQETIRRLGLLLFVECLELSIIDADL